MIFHPFGPFEIPRSANGLIDRDKESRRKFWNKVADKGEGSPEAVGCYIFSIRVGGGTLPWYVGLTKKQSFRTECLSSHKLNHYDHVLVGRKGTPLLTLLAKYTSDSYERYARPSANGHRDIQFLEKHLISLAIRRNPDLRNIQDTKFLRRMVVHGVLNTPPGRQASSVSELKNLLQLQ